MSASVLDRFIFRFATATRAIAATPSPVLAVTTQRIARIAGIAVANSNDYDFFDDDSDVPDTRTETASGWWATLGGRVTECDRLINQVCDLRGDTATERAVLLHVRRHSAPVHLDADINYFTAAVAALTPVPPAATQTTGRCIECKYFVRVGVGERCSHPARAPVGEPERAGTLPGNDCEKFIYWRSL